jgi:hypothetical protein
VILALKLFLTPLMIAGVTLAGRRWGPGVSGWAMGLPLTSGPVSLILAWQYGPQFAAHAATGTIAGQASVCIFCVTYALVARKLAWPFSGFLAVSAFLVATFVWNQYTLSLLPTFVILLVVIVVLFLVFPGGRRVLPGAASAQPVPNWDIPARMLIAATFVVVLTSLAPKLGPQLSGLLSPFPVFGLVIATFTHHQQGARAAARMLRGIVLGSLAFGSFFLVVGALLPTVGAALAAAEGAAAGATTAIVAVLPIYVLASLVALTINGFSLRLVR